MQCAELLPEMSLKAASLPASPTTLLQRTIHRRLTQSQATAGRRARRRLFSAVDADDVSRFVKRELAAIRAADRRRYNFDFERMEPLEGRFQWEPVGGGRSPCENTPLHRSARRLQFDRPLTEAATCPAASRADGGGDAPPPLLACLRRHRVGFQPVGDAPIKALLEASQLNCDQSQANSLRCKAASERLGGSRLKQTVLTDLWQTRKRAGVWEAAENPPKKRAHSLLQTPASEPHSMPHSEEMPAGGRQSVLSQLQEEH